MSTKQEEILFLDEIHEDVSVFDTVLDTLGGADFDIYKNFKVTCYPSNSHDLDWTRVGEYLFKAIEKFDEQESKEED